MVHCSKLAKPAGERGGVRRRGDAGDFALRFGFGVADDAEAGDAEDQRRQVGVERAAGAHVRDFGGDGAGVVAVHKVGVALLRDEVFGGFGLATGVEGRAGGTVGCTRVGAGA